MHQIQQGPIQIKLDNGFTFTFTDDKEWIYKADPIPFVPKVIELPAYPVIEEIEENYVKYFEKMLDGAMNEIKENA